VHATNKYDVNFKLKLDYQTMLEMLYNTAEINISLSPG